MKEPIITNKPAVNYTLDDYNKQLIATNRFAAVVRIAELDMKAMCYKPLTRWQRFKYRIEDLKQRTKDIRTIVSGGDVHKNCGY